MRQPTVREIAKACHCSPQTISVALRGISGKVSESRRAEILKVAKSMGWRPNPLANAYMAQLKQQHRARFTGNLAAISFSDTGSSLKDLPAHLRSVIGAAKKRSEELGYSLDLIWAHSPGMNAEALERILNSRNILGVFLSSEGRPTPWIADMKWTNTAVCASGFRKTPIKIDTINHDRAQGVDIAFRKVIDCGYRKIGFACNSVNLALGNGKDLFQYQWLARTEFQKNTAEPFIFDYESDCAPHDLEQWIRDEQVDAILGTGKTQELFRSLPSKLQASISYADLDVNINDESIAGISQRHDTTGLLVAEWLAKQVESNTFGIPKHPLRILYSPEWKDGTSLKVKN